MDGTAFNSNIGQSFQVCHLHTCIIYTMSAKLLHHSVVTLFYNFTSLEVYTSLVPCSKTTMHYSDVQRTLKCEN